MMRAATRHHLLRAAATVLLAIGLAWAVAAHRARDHADALLAQAMEANYRNLPGLFRELACVPRRPPPAAPGAGGGPVGPTMHRREVAEMLLYLDRPTAELGAALRDRLTAAQAQPEEVAALRGVLAAHPAQAGAEALRRVLRDEAADPAARLRAACACRPWIRPWPAAPARRPRRPRWPRRCWPSIAARSRDGWTCSARSPRTCCRRSPRSAATPTANPTPRPPPPRPWPTCSGAATATSSWPGSSPIPRRWLPACSSASSTAGPPHAR